MEKGANIYDVAVIGGGIVGTATAMAMLQSCDVSLILLEAENRLAAHQTGNNSGVIHSGIYYRPGSLKAKTCVAGRQALYRFCREHGIAHEACSKIVVAADESQVPALMELERRGLANGLKGVRRLASGELRELEPNVAGVAGLYVPETGIVDFVRVNEKYAEIVEQSGGRIRLNSRVTGVIRKERELILETTAGEVVCRNLINCGGLQTDRITRMCGIIPGLKIIPFRGEYYNLIPEKHSLVRNLIYPVPDPRFPFLGVHFTRMIDGSVEVGPNAVLALKREGYGKTSFSLRDFLDIIFYRGFWVIALKYFRTGLKEMYRSLSRRAFVKAMRRLVPDLESKDLKPGGSGVRAQAVEPDGFLVDDFRIMEAENMIHVLNAPSPAATASISIGETIAGMACRNFGLKPRG